MTNLDSFDGKSFFKETDKEFQKFAGFCAGYYRPIRRFSKICRSYWEDIFTKLSDDGKRLAEYNTQTLKAALAQSPLKYKTSKRESGALTITPNGSSHSFHIIDLEQRAAPPQDVHKLFPSSLLPSIEVAFIARVQDPDDPRYYDSATAFLFTLSRKAAEILPWFMDFFFLNISQINKDFEERGFSLRALQREENRLLKSRRKKDINMAELEERILGSSYIAKGFSNTSIDDDGVLLVQYDLKYKISAEPFDFNLIFTYEITTYEQTEHDFLRIKQMLDTAKDTYAEFAEKFAKIEPKVRPRDENTVYGICYLPDEVRNVIQELFPDHNQKYSALFVPLAKQIELEFLMPDLERADYPEYLMTKEFLATIQELVKILKAKFEQEL